MVLTDREIQSALQNNQIIISPNPVREAYSSTSVDLNLSPILQVWKESPPAGVDQIVSPSTPGYKFNDFVKEFTSLVTMDGDGFVVEPLMFLLAWTMEEVELPSHTRLAARVEGKSSLARLGIGIHITAPTIHAGFRGPIQLEVCNHGRLRVKLVPEMPVCQLIFEQTLGTPDKGYAGQFLGQAKK
jgi:dCTP deaminase